MDFVTENIFLIAIAFLSGAMLLWPVVNRGMAGASLGTLQATRLMNDQGAVVVDVRLAAGRPAAGEEIVAGDQRILGPVAPGLAMARFCRQMPFFASPEGFQ